MSQSYIQKMADVYNYIISYIESEDDDDVVEKYQELTTCINTKQIVCNKEEFKTTLRIISKISSNHYRFPFFFNRIESILQYFSENIKKNFTNKEIFNIFCINKRIILFLLKNDIMKIDEQVSRIITENLHFYTKMFRPYFLPEIKNYIDENQFKKIEKIFLKIDPRIFNDFENKRLLGENETYLCQLIRNDSIEDFITYYHKNNLTSSTKIKPSIFETNSMLLKKEPSIIEYSAFFGSIRIFMYLISNGTELNQSLLPYAIHSNNSELINYLEENLIKPELYEICLKESIKCHHKNLTEYFLLNFTKLQETQFIENAKIGHFAPYCLRYYNFSYFPKNVSEIEIFQYLCRYGYLDLVKNSIQSFEASQEKLEEIL